MSYANHMSMKVRTSLNCQLLVLAIKQDTMALYLELVFLVAFVGAEILQKRTAGTVAGVVLILCVVAKALL